MRPSRVTTTATPESSSMKASGPPGNWVERQVGAAGLEDAEDADDGANAALGMQPDDLPRLDAGVPEAVGELVGARFSSA